MSESKVHLKRRLILRQGIVKVFMPGEYSKRATHEMPAQPPAAVLTHDAHDAAQRRAKVLSIGTIERNTLKLKRMKMNAQMISEATGLSKGGGCCLVTALMLPSRLPQLNY